MQENTFSPKNDIKIIPHYLKKEDFYKKFVHSNTPVVITEELELSKKQWTFNWLRENIGDLNITVGHGVLTKSNKDFKRRNTTIREYIDSILSEQTEIDYLGAVDLTKKVPSLKQQVSPHPYYQFKKIQRINFFIGPRNTVSQLHCDYGENILSQLVGRKRLQLYAPNKEFSNHKMHESLTSSYNYLESEEISQEQKQILLSPDYDFVLNSGQILYIPYGWWHRVTSLEPSISIAQWWLSPRQLAKRVIWAIKSTILLRSSL